MKTISIIIAAGIAICAAADLPKFDKLSLKSGREYSAVQVTQKRPDGISIRHADGTARIKFEDLPSDVAAALGGFDAVAANESRKSEDAKDAAVRAEIDRDAAAALIQNAKITTEKKRNESAAPAIIRAIGSAEGGELCDVAWPLGPNKGAAYQDAAIFIRGMNAVDGDLSEVGLIPEVAMYTYTTSDGHKATVRAYSMAGKPRETSQAPFEFGHIFHPRPTSPMGRIGGGG